MFFSLGQQHSGVEAQTVIGVKFAPGTSNVILYLRTHASQDLPVITEGSKKKRAYTVDFVKFLCNSAFEAKCRPFAASDG
jgi:hypothetical protein